MWKRTVAFCCHLLAALSLLIFALVYLFRSEFMPYHAVAVGQNWAEVDPAFQVLTLALMKVAGGGWLATALAVIILLLIPFRKGARWADWAIPVIGLPASVSSLYVTLYVAHHTPASPPWIAAALGTMLLIVGFICSILPTSKKS